MQFRQSGSCQRRLAALSVQFSGFLGDYTDLTPTNNSNQVFLRYINSTALWSTYTAVRLEPVPFWAGPDSKVSVAMRQMLTDYAYQKFAAALTAKGILGRSDGTDRRNVRHPRPAFHFRYRATGEVAQHGFKSRDRGFAFSCSIQTEGAAIDSMSRQREVARVDKRFGGASIKNADVWEWGDAEKAIDLWAELAATRLADLQPGNAA
jgi:hypothetical protein